MSTFDEAREELIRSRGFIRGAETQLTKALDKLDAAMAAEPEEPEPEPTPDPEPEPDLGTDEPVFGAHPDDVLRFDEDFAGYTSVEDMNESSPLETAALQWTELAAGRNGTQAVEQKRGQDQGNDLVLSTGHIGGDHLLFTYWFRTSPGWDPASHRTDGMKALMLNHDGSANRHQWPYTRWEHPYGTRDVTTFAKSIGREETTTGGVGEFFCWPGRLRDTQPPNFGPASQDPDWADSPWPNGLNDGEWHRVTGEIKGAGDNQYVRAWLDGVLFWDDSGQGHQYPAVERWRWGGNYARVDGAENGSLYLDHVTIWVREAG